MTVGQTAYNFISSFNWQVKNIASAYHRITAKPYNLRVFYWLTAATLGFLHVWADRYALKDVDGLSYLDIGDAYFRGDWNTAVNAYWSPFYSWLLGLALAVLNPSPYWELSVARLVNLAIYLAALGCFDFFLRGLIRHHRRLTDQAAANEALIDEPVTLPEWAWLALGYSFFIWSSLYMINIAAERPDLCLTAFIYLERVA